MKNSGEEPRKPRYLYRLKEVEMELDRNPQGQRKRGRPKQTWWRSVHNEALGEGKSWGEVKQLARNRIRW